MTATNPAPLWRTGRKVSRHLYLQHGPEPSDADPPIGTLDTAELAAQAVEAVNAITRIRAFAAEMRTYCSPHGVAADYADRLEALLPPDRSA